MTQRTSFGLTSSRALNQCFLSGRQLRTQSSYQESLSCSSGQVCFQNLRNSQCLTYAIDVDQLVVQSVEYRENSASHLRCTIVYIFVLQVVINPVDCLLIR